MGKIVKFIDEGEGCEVLVARIRSLGYSPNLHHVWRVEFTAARIRSRVVNRDIEMKPLPFVENREGKPH